MANTKKSSSKDIKHKPIKVFSSNNGPVDKDGNVTSKSEFLVESWVIDGKETAPKPVRREYFPSKEIPGGWKAGKAKGLMQSDVLIFLDNCEEIGMYVGIPAAKITEVLATRKQGGAEPAQTGSMEVEQGTPF